MTARFTVLASGSSGNASLLEFGGFGLLIDCGLGPQVLAERLAVVGRGWKDVNAALLTHTHSDHWNALTLAHFRRLHISLIAHSQHHDTLSARRDYAPLRRAGLTREYTDTQTWEVGPGLIVHAAEVPHDSVPTFAFRFESAEWALGFASDVGHETPALTGLLAGVDVLAIEFNHDVEMQRRSGRPKILIDRVLGRYGHLSNVQAAALTREVARHGKLRHLVQLHLSRDCNRPDLAASAGHGAVPGTPVITASQYSPTQPITLVASPNPRPQFRPRTSIQPCLPGFESPAREIG